MHRNTLFMGVVLCIGIVSAYYLLRANPSQPGIQNGAIPTVAPGLTREHKDVTGQALDRLQQRLELAEQERVWLAERVAALEAATKSGASNKPGNSARNTNGKSASSASAQSLQTVLESLLDAGIPMDQAAWIQARLDEYDLKKLHLPDRARHEGWLNTTRYHKELREARDGYRTLRPEIGDDAYDRMLYALGHNNRVVVRDVMRNSTAEQYDLRVKDRIIEYDGQRVFTGQELNKLVSRGASGAPVQLQVKRDDQLLEFYLPQGPLGIRLAAGRELP